MIPLKLTLQNFLSYRDDNPTLDLSGIRVACLCGNNGHGKSALLDGITWALWGKARGGSHADLVHHGRSNMQVDLEFNAAGSLYRVSRRYHTSRGSDLQLQLKGSDGFLPVTGNSIRHSQAKIDRIIGMDYDTFINSAFLIQGRADEFTNKTPAERKEVLGKIIGLDRFNELQQRSRDKARQRRERGDFLEGEIEYKRKETAAKPQLQQELEAVARDLNDLSDDLDEKICQASELRLEIQDLERRISEAEEVRRLIPRLKSEISHYETEARQHSSHIETYQDLINRQPSIQKGYSQYQHTLDEINRLNAARTRFDELTQLANSLHQTIARARARLEEQHRSHQHRLESELKPAAQKAPEIQRRLSETATILETISTEEKTLHQESKDLQHLSSQAHALTDSLSRLESEGRNLRNKLDLLNASHQDARCPLCDATLGDEGCHRLAKTYEAEIRQKRNEYTHSQQTLKDLKSREQSLTRRLRDRQNSLQRRRQQAQRQSAILERELEDSRRAQAESENLQKELLRLDATIKNNNFASHEQTRLTDAQASLQALNYSPQDHSKLDRKLQQLQSFQLLHQQLSQAQNDLPQEKASLAQAHQALCERRNHLSQMQNSLASLDSDQARLAQSRPRLSRLTSRVADLESRQKGFLAQKGRLQGSLQRLEDLERQITRQTRELNHIREEQAIYEELRVAFGREGVQALLIDTILPQIEDEANRLLGRMTEGRMTVRLETQRPLRSQKGRLAETLQITVSDELGHRPYEMFSGGEAFRINLALRIALSKVLANRSGAPLPTLFIDEGFGTQDSAGREQILDVLGTLEHDFQCIIVITHLEDLKDYFPVRIEVQKRDGASTARIT